MIGISFGTWNQAGGAIFNKERIRIKGYIWTPFVRLKFRYKPFWNYNGCLVKKYDTRVDIGS
jgi:hypothetical protein